MAALAEYVVTVTSGALAALADVRHIAPCDTSLQSGVEALQHAYRALGLPPPHIPPEYLPARPAAVVVPLRPPPKQKPREESHWDPEPLWEASRCRALLLEIIRRAIHDWVLYRQHERLELKQRASNAYTWLFEESPGHSQWEERKKAQFFVVDDDGQTKTATGVRTLTSFLAICDAVGMSPDLVRERARNMTVKSIMHAGRPAERRKLQREDSVDIEEYGVTDNCDLESIANSSSRDSFDVISTLVSSDI